MHKSKFEDLVPEGLLDEVKKVLESSEGTTPKTDKEKKLAALAPPKDKITLKDVLVGRSVIAKEEIEQIDELSKSTLASYVKKATKDARFQDRMSGYVDAEHWHTGKFAGVKSKFDQLANRRQKGIEKAATKLAKEEAIQEAPVDGVAPGSMPDNKHLCATKVMHKEWKEGVPVFEQHAQPAKDGSIAWYDVMFEHGIEKRVSVSDLEIVMSESHMNHKKKMKEEVEDLEEAKRGRPRKNPLPAEKGEEDSDSEASQHIINQLRKAASSMTTMHVNFQSGKHPVKRAHARAIINKYNLLKPADREKMQSEISKSPQHMMKHV